MRDIGDSVRHAESVYRATQEAVRASDAKAGLVLAVNGITLGFGSASITEIREAIWALSGIQFVIALGSAILLAVALMISIASVLISICPRLNLNKCDSMIYFAHIFSRFKRDCDAYHSRFAVLTDEQLLKEYTDQIVLTSEVCTKKYMYSKRATIWTGCSFGAATVLFLAITLFPSAG